MAESDFHRKAEATWYGDALAKTLSPIALSQEAHPMAADAYYDRVSARTDARTGARRGAATHSKVDAGFSDLCKQYVALPGEGLRAAVTRLEGEAPFLVPRLEEERRRCAAIPDETQLAGGHKWKRMLVAPIANGRRVDNACALRGIARRVEDEGASLWMRVRRVRDGASRGVLVDWP